MAKAKTAPAAEPTTALVRMPTFAVKPQKSYEVEGNFDEVEAYLKGVRAKYKDLVFTTDTIESAKIIKAELVPLRTSLEKIQDGVKKERFNDPKKIFDAKMNALIGIIGEVEKQIDAALSAEDQKRIDELNEVFASYAEHFQTVYSLEDRYFTRVVYEKSWYNKTASEKDSKAALEAQFVALKAEQTARNGSIKLIKKALKDSPEINEDEQIRKLDNGMDVASILEWIEGEIERIAKLKDVPAQEYDDTEDEEEEEEEEQEKETPMRMVMGVAEKINFDSDFPTKTKNLVIQITYPVDCGDALTALFKGLKEKGITTRMVKPEELVGGKLK